MGSLPRTSVPWMRPQHRLDERIVERSRKAVQLMAIADGGDGLAKITVTERITAAGPLAGGAVNSTGVGQIGEEAGDRFRWHR